MKVEERERPVATKAILDRVGTMARLQREAAKRVEDAENALKEREKELYKIEREDMPELLREVGLQSVTLEDGTKVTLADEFSCGISGPNNAAAMEWLREHRYGGIIKMSVSIAFGKDEVVAADKLYLQLVKKFGAETVTNKEGVHPQTLKAFIKERMAAANDPGQRRNVPPAELFGIQPYSIAKIVMPKAVKG